MSTPNGALGPVAKCSRLVLEDDHTFAPPPMSAYSIAVFSGTKKSQPGDDMVSIGKKYDWESKENAVLKESLKRKLSSHFNDVNTDSTTSSSISPEGRSLMKISPASRSSSTISCNGIIGLSNNTRSSHCINGVAGPTPFLLNETLGSVDSSSSHGQIVPGPTTLTKIDSLRCSESQIFGFSVHSQSFDAMSPKVRKISEKKNCSRNISWSSETSRSSKNQSHTPLKEDPDSISNLDSNNSVPIASHKQMGSSPAKLESRTSRSPFDKLSPQSSINLSRPGSRGLSTKKSRIMKRFSLSGQPKRTSETVPTQDEKLQVIPNAVSKALYSNKSSENLKAELMAKNGCLNSGRVSPDSEFFKSLKRSKESTLKDPDDNPIKNLSGRIKSSLNDKEITPQTDGNQLVQSTSPQAKHSIPRYTSQIRQPLHDISPGNSILSRNTGDFKKPRLPNAHVMNHRAILREPTPKVITNPTNVVSHPDGSRSITSPISNDEVKRNVICINSKEYDKLEILGRGGSSKVYKVRSVTDKKTYALKKVTFDQFDESCVSGFKGEIDLLKRLKHEVRVVSLIDHASETGSLYLLMECGDVDLAQVLQNKLSADASLDINFVRFHASEVFHCIQAVHNAGIVHSDLKPANFLFVGGILKIIDFGIANAVPEYTVNIYRNSQIGTPNYMAPEALIEINPTASVKPRSQATTWRVGRPSDIWSCGCIIYQMIYGRAPYAAFPGQQRLMAIMNPQIQVQYPATGLGGRVVPLSAIELIKKCLARNPNDRWTVEQCLESDFIRPKAVNEIFVKKLLHSAIALGHRSASLQNIDESVNDEFVSTILSQIRDLNFA